VTLEATSLADRTRVARATITLLDFRIPGDLDLDPLGLPGTGGSDVPKGTSGTKPKTGPGSSRPKKPAPPAAGKKRSKPAK
jgi:hypothetical protein